MFKIVVTTLALLGAVACYAQTNEQGADTVGHPLDTPSISKQKRSAAGQQLVKIKVADLPQNVTKTIQGHGYSDWTIQDAYKNISLNEYSVRLKRGNDVVWYTFDARGNRVKE